MRDYFWHRENTHPEWALWHRAKNRAASRGIIFDVQPADITIPDNCPVLGIPLRIGEGRSPNSPSLDRIEPTRGYVSGNVRVISDRANRLKGARDLKQLRDSAARSSGPFRTDFLLVAEYVQREALLRQVRFRAAKGKPGWPDWEKVAIYLDEAFSRGPLIDLTEENTMKEYVAKIIRQRCQKPPAKVRNYIDKCSSKLGPKG